ncbi:thiolase family protein [Sinimarinibacterium flocculans]|uniref:thiolase family protein n=1 Tax=Sinimarinibacterium flocculans TaxID=985250 RepID=UPI002493535F|nr:thiolase family protein [Sinimarinibacterium flocculans]
MRRAAILGTAAIPVRKYQRKAGEPLQVVEHEIVSRLVVEAMRDAQVEKREINAIVCAHPRPYTRQKYFSTFMAHYLRLPCSGVVMETMGNGMTAALAFDKAVDEILLGRADVALAFGINMEMSVTAAEHMQDSVRATGDVDFHAPSGLIPISWYAMDAVRYMHEHGATRAQLASVAVKNRAHAEHNPLAQYRTPITLDEVLAQRPIVEPLGLFEVPPRGDGAACLLVASEDRAKASGLPYALIRGRGFFHEGAHQISEVPNDMIRFIAAETASKLAYEAAGIGPGNLDLAELYAPCTIVEVLASEALGLAPRGQGAAAAAAGETRLGGRIPVSTSGGLTSRGHPSYATPLYNLIELAEQLRGRAGERQVRDARLALSSNELGNYNAALIHVLEAVA